MHYNMYTASFNSGFSEIILDTLLSSYSFGRYLEDRSFDRLRAKDLVRKNTLDFLNNKNNFYILASDQNGRAKGIILFRKSEWDTDHFGYNVGVIDNLIVDDPEYQSRKNITTVLLDEFDKWSLEGKIRFVTLKISSQELPVIHAIEQSGFGYIENWIYNHFDLRKSDAVETGNLLIRSGIPSDREYMIKYSKGAFVTHRFHADNRIDVKKADSLYEKWIDTAFSDPTQEIAVYDHEGIPTAFMIYYKYDLSAFFGLKFAMWKMGLVNPELGHQGIGFKFVKGLIKFHANQNLDIIESGLSIRNLPSLNWHNKLNFKITSTLVTFHKWYF